MSKKKRILILGWRDPKNPLAGGAEQVVHEHAKFWVKKGFQVVLFSSRFYKCSSREILDDVLILRSGNPYIGVRIAAYIYYRKNSDYFDLVIDQFHGFPFFTPFYVKKPIIALIQEVAKEVWFLNHLSIPFNWIIGFLGYTLEPLIFKFYSNIQFMTGSKSAKTEVSEYGVNKKDIMVIPHGVILNNTKENFKKNKKFTIAFLGVLTKDKGIEDAIKCFSILNTKGDFQFWIIGKADKKYQLVLLGLIKKLKLDQKIKLWGFVTQEKKFELLQKAHLLVNPSVREGWGLVNVEANAVGTPVIAYRSAGIIDSVKNHLTGLLCNENTPENLADKIFFLLEKKKLYIRMQKNAKNWAKTFDWNKSVKLSFDLINKVILKSNQLPYKHNQS